MLSTLQIQRSYTATKQNRAFSAFLSNCTLFQVIFRARFIVSLAPSFLLGLGALLSSYLEGALYKFHREIEIEHSIHSAKTTGSFWKEVACGQRYQMQCWR